MEFSKHIQFKLYNKRYMVEFGECNIAPSSCIGIDSFSHLVKSFTNLWELSKKKALSHARMTWLTEQSPMRSRCPSLKPKNRFSFSFLFWIKCHFPHFLVTHTISGTLFCGSHFNNMNRALVWLYVWAGLKKSFFDGWPGSINLLGIFLWKFLWSVGWGHLTEAANDMQEKLSIYYRHQKGI